MQIPRGILDMKERFQHQQRRTAIVEEVVNQSNYTLKIINNNAMKMMTNKLKFYRMIINILQEKS
jgi:hypothetical protein